VYRAALEALLELPSPPGPGRLAFNAIPATAADTMLEALKAAGHAQLWNEPCFRYARAPKKLFRFARLSLNLAYTPRPGPRLQGVAENTSDRRGASQAAIMRPGPRHPAREARRALTFPTSPADVAAGQVLNLRIRANPAALQAKCLKRHREAQAGCQHPVGLRRRRCAWLRRRLCSGTRHSHNPAGHAFLHGT
jgi:hypothetical protein